MPTKIKSPMAFLSSYLTTAPSLARASDHAALATLGLADVAKDAQQRLRMSGLQLGEWTSTHSGRRDRARRHAARDEHHSECDRAAGGSGGRSCTTDGSLSDRLWQLGGDENVMWLTANDGPDCVPLDNVEFRINVNVRLNLPIVEPTLRQHHGRQTGCLKPDAGLQCLIGGDTAKLHDVGCHLLHSA